MTLRPHPDHSRFVAAHPDPEPIGECMTPRCTAPAVDRHHIWARSQVGKTDVVRDVVTEELLPNIANLCRRHHRDVTGDVGGHKARIAWDDGRRLFIWHARSVMRPLDPQPVLPAAAANPVAQADLLRAAGRDEEADLLERGVALGGGGS